MSGFTVPVDSNNRSGLNTNVLNQIHVDGINVKVLPAGSSPTVVYRIGDDTVHPEGWNNVLGEEYLDFYISTGATGAGIQGEAGLDVDHITRTSGDGSAGTIDVYTMYQDAGELVSLGTFDVTNGANGIGDLLSTNNLDDLADVPTALVNLNLNNVANILSKFDATVAPVVTDDSDSGYAVGSRWINIVLDSEHVCVDSTVGAAVWAETTVRITDTPVLSPTTKSQGETIEYIITITNWSNYTSPVLTIVTEGSTGYTDNVDGTITITPPAYTGADDIHIVSVQCTDATNVISETAEHTLTVLEITADTGVVWASATLNDTTIPTTPNATIVSNVLTADADSAISESIKITSGNTNTNAEVTTIDTAVNYTLIDNPELVIDGTFDIDTSEWTPINSILSVVANRMRVANDGAVFGGASAVFTTEVGITYYFSWEAVLGTSGASQVRLGTAPIGTEYYSDNSTNTSGSTSFIATTTTTYITVYAGGSVSGQYCDYDNISASINGLPIVTPTNTLVSVLGQVITDGDTLLLNDGASTTLAEFDTTSNITGNTDIVSSTEPFGDSSLLAKYELESDATDTLATYNGTPTALTYSAGKFGNGANFNGTSSTISLATPIPITTTYSVSFVVKLSGTNQQRVMDGTTTNNSTILFTGSGAYGAVPANSLAFIDNGANTNHYYIPYTYDDILTSFVVTVNGTTVKIYKNGVEVVGTNAVTTVTGLDIKNIGSTVGATNYWLNGLLDQFEVYNKTLSDSEASLLHNQRTPATIDLTTASLTSAPTTIVKMTADIDTSLVVSAGGDSYVARTPQSHTGNIATTPATITDVFDIDTRVGEDYKVRMTQHDSGDELSSIITAWDKIG